MLSPSLVILSAAKNPFHSTLRVDSAKHLGSSSQDKLREESLLLISNQCEMLRAVYPERGMKGILRCAQNDKRRAQHDKNDFFTILSVVFRMRAAGKFCEVGQALIAQDVYQPNARRVESLNGGLFDQTVEFVPFMFAFRVALRKAHFREQPRPFVRAKFEERTREFSAR